MTTLKLRPKLRLKKKWKIIRQKIRCQTVIDDEREMGCLAAERLLHVKEFDFETNPNDALKRTDLNDFDAIFVDHEFGKGVMNGVELTRQLRQIAPNVVLIGQTASAETEHNNYMNAGASDVIEKPFTPKKFKKLWRLYFNENNGGRVMNLKDVLPEMLKSLQIN